MVENILQTPQKRSRIRLFAGIITSIVFLYFILGFIALTVFAGDPPKGEKGLNYHFSLESNDPFLTPGSEILIPAIVDASNKPIFSESELKAIRQYSRYGEPDESAYPCDIRYTTTKEGTMISLRPFNITDPRRFSADFSKKDYRGDTFLLSPAIKFEPQFLLNLYTFPVYIRNSTISGRDRIPIDSTTLGLSVCGYDPRDPYVCKGFASRPFQRYEITQDLVPVLTNEYGEYNHYRYCANIVTWPELFFNPPGKC